MSGVPVYNDVKNRLRAAGIGLPELEARILLREFAGVTDTQILAGDIPEFNRTPLDNAIERRIAGEPMGRILGYREFWGRKFHLSPATLEPRPDTETLIEAVLCEKTPFKSILDLGTGTGCILLTLLHEISGSYGVGVDLAEDACLTARRNAREQNIAERVSFVNGDWTDSLSGPFDVVVSNPPYIPSDTIANLEKNVRNFDPLLALDGGNDGMAPYRNLLKTIKKLLAPGAPVFFEIGQGQLPDIRRLVETRGATLDRVYEDLGGIERVVKISFGDK